MDVQNCSINYGIHSTLEPRQVKQACDVPHLCQCSTPTPTSPLPLNLQTVQAPHPF